MEFYQEVKTKKVRQTFNQVKVFQSLNASSAQDIAIPYAFCELCSSPPDHSSANEPPPGLTRDNFDEKQRAVCECLNCNIPLCSKCKQKHVANPRLAQHKIVQYQQMIFNANKFGKKGGNGAARGENSDSNNTSVSPSRMGTPNAEKTTKKSPKISKNDGGISMISANSSGRFSRNMFGNNGAGQTATNESVRMGGGGGGGGLQEPLELMSCPSHEGLLLDQYSINIREFMCRACCKDIEGTQRELDLNPVPLEEAMRVLEQRLNMQQLVNLDEKVRGLLDLVRKKKEFATRDRDESIK